MIEFNGMSTSPGLFYAKKLNTLNIITFFAHSRVIPNISSECK